MAQPSPTGPHNQESWAVLLVTAAEGPLMAHQTQKQTIGAWPDVRHHIFTELLTV